MKKKIYFVKAVALALVLVGLPISVSAFASDSGGSAACRDGDNIRGLMSLPAYSKLTSTQAGRENVCRIGRRARADKEADMEMEFAQKELSRSIKSVEKFVDNANAVDRTLRGFGVSKPVREAIADSPAAGNGKILAVWKEMKAQTPASQETDEGYTRDKLQGAVNGDMK